MVSGASGAARSQKAQQWKGPNTIGTRERAWQKRQRRVETCNAGRAGAHRPSEALHPTRSSDMLPRIARERVPTVPHVAKTRRNVPRRIAPAAHFERNYITIICETVHQGFFAEMQSIRPHSGSDSRVVCLTNVYLDSSGSSRNGRLGELKRSLIVLVLELVLVLDHCCCRAGREFRAS